MSTVSLTPCKLQLKAKKKTERKCVRGQWRHSVLCELLYPQVKADIAASFQHVATVHLVEKLERAIQWVKDTDPDVRCVVLGCILEPYA